jgi:hypothetical protein
MSEIQNTSVFNDPSFWINVVVGLIAFISVFIIGGLKKDVDNLYTKSNENEKQIGIIAKDVENHRKECDKNHDERRN